MAVGPRLDTPSAIGEEGRPRATSLAITTAVVLAVSLAVGVAMGRPLLITGRATGVGLIVAGIALLDRDRLGAVVVGHLCFLPAACAVLLSTLLVFDPLSVGLEVALLGLGAAWADILDRETITAVLASSAVSYLYGLLWLLSLGVLYVAVFAFRGTVRWSGTATEPFAALLAVLGLGTVTALSLLGALRAVPIAELMPVGRRDAVADAVARTGRGLLVAAVVSFGLLIVALLLGGVGVMQVLLSLPAVSGVLLVVASPPVFQVLSIVTGIAVFVAVAVVALRRTVRATAGAATRYVGAAIAAVGYVVIVGVITWWELFGSLLGALVVAGSAAAPILVYLVAGCGVLALSVGLVPDRAGAPALVAAGLVLVAIGSASSGLPAVVVFGAVAGGLVAWDMGTFGLGLTAELGHLPETRRLELYHGVFVVALGLIAVAGLTAVEAVRQVAGAGIGTPTAMALAALGVVLLVLPLRG